jgi:Mitochondrial carrier protein
MHTRARTRALTRAQAFTGALQCLRATVSQEGLASLWKGATPALSGAVVENVVAFAINKQLKLLWPQSAAHPVAQPLGYGFVTGAVTGDHWPLIREDNVRRNITSVQ